LGLLIAGKRLHPEAQPRELFFFDNPQLVYPRRAAVIVCRQAVGLAVLSPEDQHFVMAISVLYVRYGKNKN